MRCLARRAGCAPAPQAWENPSLRGARWAKAHPHNPCQLQPAAANLPTAVMPALPKPRTQAGNANDALVIPVGLAFMRSVALRPQLNRYVQDKRHPSMLGSDLAATTV